MTFTAQEAEQILRECWDDSEIVGGFHREYNRLQLIREFVDRFGDEVAEYTLIGETTFLDYEEGCTSTLWVRNSDGTLWRHDDGASVYVGEYGSTFLPELETENIADWLELVHNNLKSGF